MNREESSGRKHAGIRLSRLNILLICIGLILVGAMVVSMYKTTASVRAVVTFTNSYLSNQQTGGMLRDISEKQGEQAMAFVQSGEPGPAMAYEGQMNAISAQLALYDPVSSNSAAADDEFQKAMEAFNTRSAAEKRAMRLAADDMPRPAFETLPAFLKETELSAEDLTLSPEEKKAAAVSLLTAEDYTAAQNTIREAIDLSHRYSSEEGRIQAGETLTRVKGIVGAQTVLIILFIVIALLALILNRALIISPIRKSVQSLDRREPIPEEGCYEMRHLARVYNEVLKDNEEKTEELSYTASHDALTGVYNRDAFDKLYREIEKKEHYGIIMLDVDHFKQYNDDFGHDIGDRVLCTAVETIKRHFRSEDHISRVGGDEFCIIMPGTDQDQAEKIRDKIIQINQELAENCGDLPPITVSAGIAFWNRPQADGSLLKDADSALMDLKKTRDKSCAVYPE